MAPAALEAAIEAYTRGFESDPRDHYPGVNAVTLLLERGDAEAIKEAERLVPLVTFAVVRRGGLASSRYWDLATLLELSAIGADWAMAGRALPKVLDATHDSWRIKTTHDNLALLKAIRARAGQPTAQLDDLLRALESRFQELHGHETSEARNAS